MRRCWLVVCLVAMVASMACAEEETSVAGTEAEKPERSVAGSVFHGIVMYVPNRVMDVLDIVRLRIRLGIGAGAGVRVTKPLTVFIGGYEAIYFGLPGPRLKPEIPWPFGVEEYVGLQAGIVDGTAKEDTGPGYSSTEIGVSVHAFLPGIDIGIDPGEVVDLALGLLFIDIRGDDV